MNKNEIEKLQQELAELEKELKPLIPVVKKVEKLYLKRRNYISSIDYYSEQLELKEKMQKFEKLLIELLTSIKYQELVNFADEFTFWHNPWHNPSQNHFTRSEQEEIKKTISEISKKIKNERSALLKKYDIELETYNIRGDYKIATGFWNNDEYFKFPDRFKEKYGRIIKYNRSGSFKEEEIDFNVEREIIAFIKKSRDIIKKEELLRSSPKEEETTIKKCRELK